MRFRPRGVTAGAALAERDDLTAEGYVIQPLGGGDYAIRIRHDRSRRIQVKASRFPLLGGNKKAVTHATL